MLSQRAVLTRSTGQVEAYFKAVGGNSARNVVQLYGYTYVPIAFLEEPDGDEPARPTIVHLGRAGTCQDALAFVFEYASGGELLDNIESFADGYDEAETWYMVLQFLVQIGSAIYSLKEPHR